MYPSPGAGPSEPKTKLKSKVYYCSKKTHVVKFQKEGSMNASCHSIYISIVYNLCLLYKIINPYNNIVYALPLTIVKNKHVINIEIHISSDFFSRAL